MQGLLEAKIPEQTSKYLFVPMFTGFAMALSALTGVIVGMILGSIFG